MCCHRQHGVAGRWHKHVAERGQVGLEVLVGGLDGCQHQSDKLSGTYERSGCGSDTIMALPTSKQLVHSASHTACKHASAKVSTLPCRHAGFPSAVPHSAGHSLHTMTSFRRSGCKSGRERKWRACFCMMHGIHCPSCIVTPSRTSRSSQMPAHPAQREAALCEESSGCHALRRR